MLLVPATLCPLNRISWTIPYMRVMLLHLCRRRIALTGVTDYRNPIVGYDVGRLNVFLPCLEGSLADEDERAALA